MKKMIFVFCILTSLFALSVSAAMACNCGKKGGASQALSCSCGAACGGGQSACTDGAMKLAQGTSQQEAKDGESKAVEVGNKICPISGDKVGGAMGEPIKHEYKGRIYNLCCKMCVKDFEKDPEKYSKIAEDEVKAKAEREMSNEEKMGHDHKGSHENHPGHDHSK